jgi:hypothetical protein
MALSHSDKALATMMAMGTTPDDWHLTPIKWVEEEREVMGQVTCPLCKGTKWVRYTPETLSLPERERTVIPPPPRVSDYRVVMDYEHAAQREARGRASSFHNTFGNCPKCTVYKRGGKFTGGGLYTTGKVPGLVWKKVLVGYPQWPKGVRFDSRFESGSHCHLCGKLIMKSWRVPVDATGVLDGKVHGMYVGEDCAKKFLHVKLKRDPESVMED